MTYIYSVGYILLLFVVLSTQLFAGSKSRYRSINEFIPHALWLMQDTTMNTSNCRCKYCQKTTQKEVHASMAPGILRKLHGTQSPTPSKPKPPRNQVKLIREGPLKGRPEPKIYAAVQRTLLPPLKRSSNVHPKHTMLVERNADLRAVHSRPKMELKRWYRVGELLWCALVPPIMSEDHNVAIQYWPGIVDEVKLKTKPIPQETDLPYATSIPGPLQSKNGNDGDIVMDAPTGSVPWTVRQSIDYRIQLLAVNHALLVPDNRLLPYQAYIPSTELITGLRKCPPKYLNFDRQSLSSFNPCPSGKPASFEAAVAPYATAVEIGASLSSYWCLTDEWSFEYSLPPPLPKLRPEQPASSEGAFSLQAALENANMHNSHIQAALATPPHRNVSGSNPGMSTQQVQSLSGRMLGREPSGSYTQLRFQGLWWGAERIWTDEFVRLKIPRRCIAPKGAENILPPSGPGTSAREIYVKSGQDPAELGAGTRGVFMRLEGLFVVDAVQEDGFTIKKECRASGMLYELADADWEDPNLSKSSHGNGVNCATATSALNSPMSFVPTPSPLNPHVPLRTGNPALNGLAGPGTSLPTSQLSHPTLPSYSVPEAPQGYVFRPILTEGHEVVVSLSLISGRYYPKILSHPLLRPIVRDAVDNPTEKGDLMELSNLWALEGLAAGFYNSVDPTHYKTSRTKMVEDADRKAVEGLEQHKERVMSESIMVDELESMDVD